MTHQNEGDAAAQMPSVSARRNVSALITEHRALLLVVLGYATASLAIGPLLHWRRPTGVLSSAEATLALPVYWFLIAAPIVVFRYRLRAEVDRKGARDSWLAGWRAARNGPFSGMRLISLIGVLLLMPFLSIPYSAWKSTIPQLVPYWADPLLRQWGRALFGMSPWRVLQPLVGRPTITRFLDAIYGPVWVGTLSFAIFAAAWAPWSRARTRFLVGYAALWILGGNVLAAIFASVGPCYYAAAGFARAGADPYAPLLRYLGSVKSSGSPLLALSAQQFLWRAQSSRWSMMGTGISAMPSMHIASIAFIACATWRFSRGLSTCVWAATFLLFIASIHLGWHYMLDGLVGASLAAAVWWTSGRIMRRSVT